jgi:MFS family permease
MSARPARKWSMLAIVGVAELFAMTLWFSATAVGPELAAAWGLGPVEEAWLTNAVQLGFVVGALFSAAVTLADLVRPRYLFAGSAFLGAGSTLVLALSVSSAIPAVALRFLTGMALAGVYPTGMKMLAGWWQAGRGMAIGVLVGALTVGSAAPHLLRVLGGVGDPSAVILGTAGLAVAGGLLVLAHREGPHQAPPATFDPTALGRIVRNRPLMLANGGYFGHMWELYAVWTWIPAYLAASFAASGVDGATQLAGLVAFGTIAVGGLGAWLAGSAADRWGRTTVTSASLVTSGAASVAAGLVFATGPAVVVPFVLVWGIVIVADSAQFSAAVSELAEPSYVGTALTLQTAVGFLLTIGSIQLVATIQPIVGWRWPFLPLAIGPAVGTISMGVLRRSDAAGRLAGGRG